MDPSVDRTAYLGDFYASTHGRQDGVDVVFAQGVDVTDGTYATNPESRDDLVHQVVLSVGLVVVST